MTAVSTFYGPSAGVALLPLVAVCFAALILLALVPSRASDATTLPPATMRGALLAALSALLSTIGYAAYDSSGDRLALAASDVTMMLSPAILWCALRRVNRNPFGAVMISLVAAVVMAAVSLLTNHTISSGIKVGLLVLFCAALVLETRRRPLVTLRGARVVAISVAAYAIYSALRIIAGLVWGPGSAIWAAVFSTPLTTLMSAGVILCCTVGFWLLRAASMPPAPTPRALVEAGRIALAAGRDVAVYRAMLPVLATTRVAYGTDAANVQRESAHDALRDALPDAAVARMTGGAGYVCLVSWPADSDTDASGDAGDASDATAAIMAAFAARTGATDLSARVDLTIERVVVRDEAELLRALDAAAS